MASLGDLTSAQTDYETAYHDALSQDKFKVTHRNDCRVLLTGMLKNMASYCELVAQGNVSKLETSGYDLRLYPLLQILALPKGPLVAG